MSMESMLKKFGPGPKAGFAARGFAAEIGEGAWTLERSAFYRGLEKREGMCRRFFGPRLVVSGHHEG